MSMHAVCDFSRFSSSQQQQTTHMPPHISRLPRCYTWLDFLVANGGRRMSIGQLAALYKLVKERTEPLLGAPYDVGCQCKHSD